MIGDAGDVSATGDYELGGAKVVVTDDVPGSEDWGDAGERSTGYATKLDGYGDVNMPWVFFEDLEPAYVYGRVGRIGEGASSWEIRPAAYETRFDDRTGRDVQTLYIASFTTSELVRLRQTDDQKLLRSWVDGMDSRYTGWAVTDR